MTSPKPPVDFADLLRANQRYSVSFPRGFDGIAHAGVAMVTCMDSRLEPLEMIGLRIGEAKILRTPGGRVTADALVGCIVGVLLLQVTRILVVPHTRCMMAQGDDEFVRHSILEQAGVDVGDTHFGADSDQLTRLRDDVEFLRHHRLIEGRALVGGFMYDVETGLLTQHA